MNDFVIIETVERTTCFRRINITAFGFYRVATDNYNLFVKMDSETHLFEHLSHEQALAYRDQLMEEL